MKTGEFKPDELIVTPGHTRWLSVASGTFKRGALVTVSPSNENRGARYGVLMQDIDATSGTVQAAVMISGVFLRSQMVNSSGAALSDEDIIVASMQDIYIQESIAPVV